MGIIDDLGSAAGRAGRGVKLRMQMDNLQQQRKDFAAQLGARLYESTKDHPDARQGNEGLYQAIERIDRQYDEMRAELAQIEGAAERAAPEDSADSVSCPNCGTEMNLGAKFCSECAAPLPREMPHSGEMQADPAGYPGHDVAEPQDVPMNTDGPVPVPANAGARPCRLCGQPVPEGQRYCMWCGEDVTRQHRPPVGRTCPSCGEPAGSADAYCGRCGSALAGASSSAQSG